MAGALQGDAADEREFLCRLQAFVGATAIGAREPAGAELDAAVPTDNQYHDLIAVLRLNRRQDRPPCGATGFAIIAAAVLGAEFPGPAVVGGSEVAVLFDEVLGLLGAGNWGGQCNEAAFADFFAVFAKAGEGRWHVGSEHWLEA